MITNNNNQNLIDHNWKISGNMAYPAMPKELYNWYTHSRCETFSLHRNILAVYVKEWYNCNIIATLNELMDLGIEQLSC